MRILFCSYGRAAEAGRLRFLRPPAPGPSLWATRLAVAGGASRVALAQQLAAHRQLQQPEVEPSGPLEIVDVMLVLKLGGLGKWAKSSALLSYGVAFGMVL